MKNDNNINLFEIDVGSLTPAEWQVFKDRAIEQAKQERAEAIGRAFRGLSAWFYDAIGRVLAAFFSGPHPVVPSRGA